LGERGGTVDHATLNRWVVKSAPAIEKQFRRRQRAGGRRGRLDERYVKIRGRWADLYRAGDRDGQTVDFLLTPQRDRAAALAFLQKAIPHQGLPEKITIDQSGSNTAAINRYNKTQKTVIVIRQSKSLNNLVEQDQRVVKRVVRPRLGFTSFWSARWTIAGVEVMPAMRKEQLVITSNERRRPAEQFDSCAA
jgi:putative transposase